MSARAVPHPTPSPIVRVLNRDVGRYHRWCTLSIPPEKERVEDFYASDVSISAGFFGTLVCPSPRWRRASARTRRSSSRARSTTRSSTR
jgi:hypothetical protein